MSHPYLEENYEGGEGDSRENAIIVHAPNEKLGIQNEYAYIINMFGERGADWNLTKQSLHKDGNNGKVYDLLEVSLVNGNKRDFWFDIGEWFGRN